MKRCYDEINFCEPLWDNDKRARIYSNLKNWRWQMYMKRQVNNEIMVDFMIIKKIDNNGSMQKWCEFSEHTWYFTEEFGQRYMKRPINYYTKWREVFKDDDETEEWKIYDYRKREVEVMNVNQLQKIVKLA